MKNCPNCGEARKGTEKFCVGCGSKFEEQPDSVQVDGPKDKKNKLPISTKQKKRRIGAVISLAVILLGLMGGHLFLKSKYDASQSLIEMNRAYSAGDKSQFLSYFDVPEKTVGNEEGFYSYIEEEGWEDLRDEIKTEANRLKTEGLTNVIVDSEGNKLISVLEKPVLFGLYDQTTFLVHPIEVEIEMPMDGTAVTVEEITVKGNKGELVKVGDFLPGEYEWEAAVSSEFAEIQEKGSTTVAGDSKNSYLFTPSVEAVIVKVTSDVPEAILWVNGKTTEKTITEMASFGPIPLDGSVEITAEAKNEKGESVKGEPLSIESETAHIRFAHIQEKVAAERTKQLEEKKRQKLIETHEYSATSFVDDFRGFFEFALNNGDFSYIEDYFPTGSKVQNDYLNDINRHAAMDNYYYYDFQSNTITGFEVVDETTFLVTTAEMFYFDSYEDRLRYNKTKVYTVKYQNGQYYIQSIDQLTSDKVQV